MIILYVVVYMIDFKVFQGVDGIWEDSCFFGYYSDVNDWDIKVGFQCYDIWREKKILFGLRFVVML